MYLKAGIFSGAILFASNIVLLILFLRYVLYGYETYGAQPFFRFLYRTTDNLCRPLRFLLPYRLRVRRDYTPLLAMGVVLLARGVLFALDDFFGGESGNLSILIPRKILESAVFFVRSGYLVLVILLFIAAALHQSREFYYSNFLLRVWTSKTERLFDAARKIVRSRNFWVLYLVVLVGLALAAGVLDSLLAWNRLVWEAWANQAILGLRYTIVVYLVALIVFVMLSWLRPEGGNPVIQVITTIVTPSIAWARRTFPWARIDIIDLSPMALFAGVMLAMAALRWMEQQIR